MHFSYFWKWSIEKYRKNELWVNLCSIGFYALCVCCVVGYKMIKFHFNNSIFHNAMRTKSTFIIYWNEHHLLLRWALFLPENFYMLYFCFCFSEKINKKQKFTDSLSEVHNNKFPQRMWHFFMEFANFSQSFWRFGLSEFHAMSEVSSRFCFDEHFAELNFCFSPFFSQCAVSSSYSSLQNQKNVSGMTLCRKLYFFASFGLYKIYESRILS